MDASTSNQRDEESIYRKITTEFKHDVIKETLKLYFGDTKTKVTEEPVELVKEVIKAIVVEASIRAAKQAAVENKTTVMVNHIEYMLLQLMLDFP